MKNKGMLIVLSAPSGCGKDTLLEKIFNNEECPYQRSISITTRSSRENEVDGVDYHFVSTENFNVLINQKGLLEYAEYGNNYYGTPKAPVDKWLDDGKTVILKIETQGAQAIKKIYPDSVSIFLVPPSIAVLEKRLRGRGTDTEESIRIRLETARRELVCGKDYDYVVVNDDIDTAVNDVLCIINAEQCRISKMKKFIEEVLEEC